MRAAFFDRDGTLMEEVSYCHDPATVRVFPGVPEALRRLKATGFAIIVITNQAGIARGLITEDQYRAVHAEFLRQVDGNPIDAAGLIDTAGPSEATNPTEATNPIDATYYCADAPGVPSARRKPAPGMVLEAAADFGIDLAQSYFIGDKAIDIECGRRAGTRTIQVLTGYGAEQKCDPDFACANVVEAVEIILSQDVAA